jgi:putative ATP-dependent endonuclease of OLD family
VRIANIHIENFRNFHELNIAVGRSAVILGENQIGKTNLLYAMRLVLDPSLPDSARQLRSEDFWDGITRPLSKDARIRISIDIADFEDDEGQLAVLAEHLVQPEPMVARLTYEFAPLPGLDNPPTKDDDFEFSTYGGDRPENRIGYDVRKRIPMEVLHALRDAEGDLGRWTKSPLKPLIDRAKSDVKRVDLQTLAAGVSKETDKVADLKPISDLASRINDKLKGMAGKSQAIETALGFSPADPDKLLRALRLLFDGKKRDISEASLGTANVLYLALRSLDLDSLVAEGSREHTFFSIEEPEAHLHPHLQRLVYRSYLRLRQPTNKEGEKETSAVTYLLTTHSPHIASVTPVESLIVLRKDPNEEATVGVSGAAITLTNPERDDIERYLDVSRAEGLFSRGILLVEGDAEKFLVPVLAARAGYDLDAMGITVCSVGGTNFAPYVKFFGPLGLNLPFAIVTDLDLYSGDDGALHDYGSARAHSLCPLISPKAQLPSAIQKPDFFETFGIFLNTSTLEIELNNSGCIYLMNSAMQALCDVGAAKKRFQQLEDDTKKAKKVISISDPKRFIKDIEYVGKGRFAQRLCAEICKLDPKDDVCPSYIMKAIKHVTQLPNS